MTHARAAWGAVASLATAVAGGSCSTATTCALDGNADADPSPSTLSPLCGERANGCVDPSATIDPSAGGPAGAGGLPGRVDDDVGDLRSGVLRPVPGVAALLVRDVADHRRRARRRHRVDD